MLTQKDFMFDKRLVERFITRGLVTRKAYNAHLGALSDVAEKSQPLFGEEKASQAANDSSAEPDTGAPQ
jgi:hypothetical protein